jgi:hypothetical protein
MAAIAEGTLSAGLAAAEPNSLGFFCGVDYGLHISVISNDQIYRWW